MSQFFKPVKKQAGPVSVDFLYKGLEHMLCCFQGVLVVWVCFVVVFFGLSFSCGAT